VRPAMQGVQNIFPAAGRAGVSRLVYISSMAAIGYSRRPDELRTEACWDEDSHNPYHHSKTCSEQEAVRLSEECGVPTVRICPTFILGPYDFRLTPSSGWIQGFVNWTSPTWRGGLNFVDVRDVAQVCVDALETGKPGQRFIVGGDNLEIRKVGRFVKKLTGVTPFHLGVPTPLAFAGGALMDFASIFTHQPPLFSRDLVHDYYGRYGFFDCSLARRTFGLNPRPGEAVIRDCIRWLLFIGKIKPAVAKRLYESLPPDPEWCEDSGLEYTPQFERASRSARWN
jgi:dihydroflavonol-4-reductase